ncbi:MAG: family 16 glycosylhydrolase [Erythrobacter sp.]|nr:family 16 glycosylhydrolase [Erythrobacter sp.]
MKRTTVTLAMASLITACGGGSSGSPSSTDGVSVVAPAPTPAPSPTPTPTPTQTPSSSFDFKDGMAYPSAAKVDIQSISVPAGSTVIHVPVTLDRETVNTVIAFVRVHNGSGGRAAPDTMKPVIFRPGDPLVKTVSFNVAGMSEGNTVKVSQSYVPDGGHRGTNGTITAQAGSTNEPIADGGRRAMTFAPYGQKVYDETGATIQFDDRGGESTFSTALAHGRIQDGNAETGYYGKADMGGFARSGNALVLKSFRLASPLRVGTPVTEYPFIAGILSGHNTSAAQFRYGTVEWVATMSNRSGSWPALWLAAKSGWPPEIDVYEGFGYNPSWRFPRQLSTNLHGGRSNQRMFTRSASTMSMDMFGLDNTLDSAPHTFAVTVSPEWITMFVDGKETMQYANPFRGVTWYPLTGLAVKAAPDDPYDQGKGTMEIHSLRIWRAQ